MADAPLDAAADGAFGGKGSTGHRAGYTDALYWALRQARKGGTLAAGEGLLIIQHYEAQLAELRGVVDAATVYCQPPEDDPWGYEDDKRFNRLCACVKDLVDAAALRAQMNAQD